MKQEQNRKGLPNEWRLRKFSEIGEIISGGTPSTNVSEYWNGDISWITPADLSGYQKKTISKGRKSITELGLKNSSARLLPEKSVLFSSRAPIGYVAIASGKLATNQGFKSIIPNENVDSEYLYYFLKHSKGKAEEAASGTTFKEISSKKFAQLEIPVPSVSVQKQIVSKIEELFSELDKGIEELKTAQQQLKVYRQAVLKWAFDSRITESSGKCIHKPFSDCLKLSQGVQIDVGLQNEKHEKGKVRFLRIIDFTQGVDTPRYIENPGDRYLVEKDDISMVRYGASTGFVCTGLRGAIANNLFKVTPTVGVSRRYLFHFLKSPVFQAVIAQNVKGAAMPAISFGLIQHILLPIPLVEEQLQLVQEIESRLSVCEKIDETIINGLKQADALRQSILKQAFEGRL